MATRESTTVCCQHGLDPAVQSLQSHIDQDVELLQRFKDAFQEIPDEFRVNSDRTSNSPVVDYHSMFPAIGRAMKTVPPWTSISNTQCIVACPINEALIWLMNTRTGSEIFTRKDINAHFAIILQKWGRYLSSSDSAKAMHDQENGWLSTDALQEVLDAVNSAHNTPIQASSFEDVFICNPSLLCHGFRSWDDFFTRRYRPGLRPVVSPDDDRVITNPCESQPFALTHDIPAKCQFSLKNRMYSLEDMLGNDPHASRFVGGTVFQGWLSALNYHRWHAPVSGTVVKVLRIPGTYFAADPSNGFENIDPATRRACPDRQAPDGSLKLISSIATRTVLLIQASNEALGMVGFVAIGMADVSSCVPIVAPGDFVSKGQEIGSFHYGGSSYCLVFEPHVRLHFSPLVHAALAGEYGVRGRCFAVNSDLASLR